MLISHFNKLIHNKIVWTVFAFIVAGSFVGASLSFRGCGASPDAERGVEGRLFGKNVDSRDFFTARYFEIGLRQDRPLSPEENVVMRQRTWMRLAALRLAEQMNITASTDEIAAVLQRDSGFQRNGAFDPELYKATIMNQLRIAPQTYERYLMQELTLKKLFDSVAAMVWAAPSEIDNRLRELTDTLTAQYVVISNELSISTTQISDEQAQSFFSANKDRFKVSETISVKYVAFPISNYASTVEIGEDRILDYYNENYGEFTTTDTNNASVTLPLEEVSDRIAATLKWREATYGAADAATDFSTSLATDRYGRATPLEQALARNGLTAQTSIYFSAAETVPGIDTGQAFTRAAFALDAADPDAYFSDAVIGSNTVYVVIANDKQAAHDAVFEDVRNEVVRLTAEELINNDFAQRLDDIRKSFITGMAASQSFEQVAASLGFKIITPEPMSPYQGYMNDDAYSRVVLPEVGKLKAGEITKVVQVGGTGLLACLLKRDPGDVASAQLLRPQIVQMLNRYRASIMVREWSASLLTAAAVEDLRPLADYSEGEEETEDSSEGRS